MGPGNAYRNAQKPWYGISIVISGDLRQGWRFFTGPYCNMSFANKLMKSGSVQSAVHTSVGEGSSTQCTV